MGFPMAVQLCKEIIAYCMDMEKLMERKKYLQVSSSVDHDNLWVKCVIIVSIHRKHCLLRAMQLGYRLNYQERYLKVFGILHQSVQILFYGMLALQSVKRIILRICGPIF